MQRERKREAIPGTDLFVRLESPENAIRNKEVRLRFPLLRPLPSFSTNFMASTGVFPVTARIGSEQAIPVVRKVNRPDTIKGHNRKK